jgi:hypothetical protein
MVGDGFTNGLTGGELLVVKLASLSYVTVIVWAPAGRAVIVNVAMSSLSSVSVPRTVVPSRKVVVPGSGFVPEEARLTVAVKGTG